MVHHLNRREFRYYSPIPFFGRGNEVSNVQLSPRCLNINKSGPKCKRYHGEPWIYKGINIKLISNASNKLMLNNGTRLTNFSPNS